MSTDTRKPRDPRSASIIKGQRLKALAALVPADSGRLIDVGCDHGTVPLDLLSEGIVKEILLIDINKEPLERAETRAKTRYPQHSDRIKYLQNDGLKGIDCRLDDVLLISGLGGETIAEVLINAFADRDKNRPSRLILQPQSKQYELRSVLQELSFSPEQEQLVLDDERFYTIIVCFDDIAEASPLSELELYIGPAFVKEVSESLSLKKPLETDKLLFEWAEKQVERLKLEGRGDRGRARLAKEWAEIMGEMKHD
ncbi:MAG: SAM-dependent methyltransferase [Clostridiaceae bacterium]|nr:SAM-dependent methyltransferase [Clostridiaceae bacterium]